ncbi:MAG: ABC transporter permease subunit [Clostridia bacterium]|nr:ABC transporter permease subunit [Clostridia bacterium]
MNKTNTLSIPQKKHWLKQSPSKYFEIFLCIVLFSFIVVPLITMLTKIDKDTFSRVFSDDLFLESLLNSFTTTIAATIISVVLAYALAWAISRTNIKFKTIFSVIFTLPMLIPSISHGMGLTILFGNNGIFTRFFNTSSHLYGFSGIVMGSVLYSFPVAFLMFVDIFKYEDYTPYEAAEILGIPKHRQFSSITFPYIRKPLISIIFTVFTMIITDYGIPLSVGGKTKTLSVLLYENTVGQLDYSAGALIGTFLLLPAVAAFLFDLFNKDKAKSSFITKEYIPTKNKVKDTFGYIISAFVSLFILTVIVSFCLQAFSTSYPSNMSFTFSHIKRALNKASIGYLDNSIFISLFTAFVGMIVTFLTAYYTARVKSKTSKFLHIISMISLAIPGLVLGLSFVITFKTSFIYGTLVILILANTIHFFASPYLMTYNALNKLNENLESTGQVLGIPKYRIIFDVIVPQCKHTLLEVFSYFFINSMMTISAVSFLATRSTKPLSLMINQFEAFNMMECAAVIALMILIVNSIMKLIIYLIKRKGEKYVNKKSI